MTVRYTRGRLSAGDRVATAAASVAVGVGVAAVTFYVVRLYLSRKPLAGGAADVGGSVRDRALPAANREVGDGSGG